MSQHIVIVGGVALGPKAACRFKRLAPGARVTMIDQSDLISYGGCGIPYYVSGEVSDAEQLFTTSFHMRRDPLFFKDVKGVTVMTKTRVDSIDREKKCIAYTDITSGKTGELSYDKLVLATGATPRKLDVSGAELPGVHYVATPRDAERIRQSISKGQVGKAVIIGAGFIGLEMAEAFTDLWGVETTVVELFDQIMPNLVSSTLATMARSHMEEKGVTFRLGESVKAIEGDGRVQRVVTDKGVIEADCVIISVGVVPCDSLAKEAGLKCHERGGILVDESMRTSCADIYAGGDCTLVKHAITAQPTFLPLGSMANRQGRVIGNNLAGGASEFESVVGSFVVKLFESSLAGAGLSLEVAKKNGFDAISVLLVQLDRAHFYPTKDLMTLELIVEKSSRKVLGIQGFGNAGDAMVGRINTVAGLLKSGSTIDDISNLELAYSPPFASAMDILNSVANLADNVLQGLNRGFGPEDFANFWNKRENGNYHFIDCREAADAKPYMERYPKHWHNIPQGEIYSRLDEIPKDKTCVLICNTGARSYEAQIMLTHKGHSDVVNLQGGMAGLKQFGLIL